MQESTWDENIVLDADHLRGFTAGDTDLEKMVLGVFAENAPGYLETLKGSDGASWRSDAHKLKGAARSIGAWQLAREAERAEFLGHPALGEARREATLSELASRLKALLSHIDERCRVLDEF